MTKKKETDALEERNLRELEDKVLKELQRKPKTSIDELSMVVKTDKQLLHKILRNLVVERHHEIYVTGDKRVFMRVTPTDILEPAELEFAVSGKDIFRDYVTIGVLAGLDSGGVNQQGDLLQTIYDTIIPAEEIDFMLVNGGLVLGNIGQGHEEESFLHHFNYFLEESELNNKEEGKKKRQNESLRRLQRNFVGQAEYVARFYPLAPKSRPKVKTYLLGGLAELSFRKYGLSIVKSICLMRKNWLKENYNRRSSDLFYRGDNIQVFKIINGGEPVNVLVMNSKKKPFRGAYTRTHRPQKTAVAIAGWFLETLKSRGLAKNYPRVTVWTDGRGIYSHHGDIAGMTFVSLPRLSKEDPTELELDTSPNIGMVVIRLFFDKRGRLLKKGGVRVGMRNLAPFIEEKGW